jgi:Uma2 family endonuclease
MVYDPVFLPNRVLRGSFIERMTDEEFFTFCQDNSEFKFERTAEGQIILMSPTGFLTGDRNSAINKQLRIWNDSLRLGKVVDSDTGFYLPNGAMRNPDAAWISHDRLSKVSRKELEGFPHICPDFVIELRSKGDTLRELKLKMKEWIDNGCLLGWLIDADEETIYIYRPDKPEEIFKDFSNVLSGDPELPGFTLILSELRV